MPKIRPSPFDLLYIKTNWIVHSITTVLMARYALFTHGESVNTLRTPSRNLCASERARNNAERGSHSATALPNWRHSACWKARKLFLRTRPYCMKSNFNGPEKKRIKKLLFIPKSIIHTPADLYYATATQPACDIDSIYYRKAGSLLKWPEM